MISLCIDLFKVRLRREGDKMEYATRNMIGRQDCKMKSGEYTDRYKKLMSIKIDEEEGLYYMMEKDKKKGKRFTLINPIKRISYGIEL